MVSKTKNILVFILIKKIEFILALNLEKTQFLGKGSAQSCVELRKENLSKVKKKHMMRIVRIKYENGRKLTLEHYNISFADYMKDIYLPAYKQKVELFYL